ncbi:hypothetical protein VZT92_011397 [Zoarces viviparus]|uniref:Uncharacterized protein n=1 Tax=Zoarces viviparus TaxID=48416 RepID=A0AAW1FEK3_ZOAVI
MVTEGRGEGATNVVFVARSAVLQSGQLLAWTGKWGLTHWVPSLPTNNGHHRTVAKLPLLEVFSWRKRMRTGTACQAKQVGHRQRQRFQQPQVRMVLQKQTSKQSHLQAGPCLPGAPEPRHQEVRSGLRGPD